MNLEKALQYNKGFNDCLRIFVDKETGMSANDRQVGGKHYKKGGEQHWDRIYRLYGRGYFVGCATKYLERFHLKNGREDLEKAIHFIEKLKELEYPVQALDGGPTERYVNQD